MKQVNFLKIGGSVLTDKNKPLAVNTEQLKSAAQAIAAHYTAAKTRLLIGSGAGSFGHYHASMLPHDQNGTYQAEAASIIHESVQHLNGLLVHELVSHGVPAISIPASAYVKYEDGQLTMTSDLLQTLLLSGTVVCIYGDMVPTEAGWRVASTEQLFLCVAQSLSQHTSLTNCLLASDVAGVLNDAGDPIPVVSESIHADAGATYDVTGGMGSKVQLALALSSLFNGRTAIIDGTDPATLQAALSGKQVGTTIAQAT